MNMRTVLLLLMLLLFLPVKAQNLTGLQKLRGTVMATASDNEYRRHKYNAFDTNEGTSFMARESTGWIGLDLGDRYTIRTVRIYPMPDRHLEQIGLEVQGANTPEFDNPVSLHKITQVPVQGQYLTIGINNRVNKFRYVRCINSEHRVSIAELEFYTDEGAQPVTYPQLTNLPTVYLETSGRFDFVNKESYVPTVITVADKGAVSMYAAEVRGRGNSTWEFMEKKPFRIRFDKKQHFLGMPANAKSWTLLANAVDKTLLRNSLAFEMSKSLGFEYTPSGVMVDVVLDGFYYGSYLASDHIQIHEDRINIDDINEMSIEALTPENISGGYHLEIDSYAYQEPVNFKSPRGLPFTVKSPDTGTALTEQKAWIENHIALTESALFNNVDEALDTYIDIESAVRYYLHSELTGNCDAYWCIPCYKKRGDDKLYFGPVWDYDQAFLTNERVPRYTETLSTQHGVAQFWFRQIMKTEKAQALLRQIWKEEKDKDLKQRLLDYLDANAMHLEQSQALNFQRWNSLGVKVWFEQALFDSYGEYIDFVKQFIDDRFRWFNELALERKALLAASTPGNTPQTWKFTIFTPESNWYEVAYDDSQWNSGNAPFGTERNLQNTRWNTNQIFIRKQFTIDANDLENLVNANFMVFHDEDVEIYLNGKLALERTGYLTDYRNFEFDKELLQAGVNTLAVSCRQTGGGQLIDVGVYVTPEDIVNDDRQPAIEQANWMVREGALIVRKLREGEVVRIFSIDGKLIDQQTASGDELEFRLPQRGIYLIHKKNEVIKAVY